MHPNRLGACANIAMTVYYRDGERVRDGHERAIGVRTRYRPLARRGETCWRRLVAPVDGHVPWPIVVRISERLAVQREPHTDQDVLVTPGADDRRLVGRRGAGNGEVGLSGIAGRHRDRARVLPAHHAVARHPLEPNGVIAGGEPSESA